MTDEIKNVENEEVEEYLHDMSRFDWDDIAFAVVPIALFLILLALLEILL